MSPSITLSTGLYDNNEAIHISFSNTSGKGILHSTREYSLAYIPQLDKWVGSMIAHGEWVDLDKKDISKLQTIFNLDYIVKEFISKQNYPS